MEYVIRFVVIEDSDGWLNLVMDGQHSYNTQCQKTEMKSQYPETHLQEIHSIQDFAKILSFLLMLRHPKSSFLLSFLSHL